MADKNSLIQSDSKKDAINVKKLLSMDTYKKRFEEVLGKRAPQFMSSVISAVNSNTDLASCEPNSVILSAMKAAVLDLPVDQNLGYAHLVPYNNSKKGYKECQFQIGWKGFVQLALRTGQYKNINAIDVREGELKKWDPLTEELVIEFIEDESVREKAPIIGYAGYFGLVNGFEKKTYWSIKKLLSHAKQYSAQYKNYGTGNWKDNQDAMCLKTVTKNMLSKWGILSIEMQDAIQADQAVIRDGNTYDYVDNAESIQQEITQNANSQLIDVEYEEVNEEVNEKEDVKTEPERGPGF